MNPSPGQLPRVGGIDQSGLYTAPGIDLIAAEVTVTAASVADSTKFASAAILDSSAPRRDSRVIKLNNW